MILIQTNTKAEKKIVDLHMRKNRLEGNLEELNRAIGYMDPTQWSSRKRIILRELDDIEEYLKGTRPVVPVDRSGEIKQFMVSVG